MIPVTVTFALADWIAKGLADGSFERVGGVIREVGSKQVVAWLREASSITSQGMPFVGDPVTGVLNLIVSGINTGVSVKGFADVKQRLDGIQGILQVTTAVSVLNLGISVMGFAVIAQRLNKLEKRLQKTEELLSKVNRKIDLSFYANFRAAIELAVNAFTMTKSENRRSCALQAINRFLETEQHYISYTDIELEQKSQIADEYLLTLSLAYIAEARCYLELEEHETALHRFQKGEKILRSRIKKFIDIMLTSNPAAYLQPQFKGQIDLRRLTRIYQWIDPNLDENAVFEMQRENLFKMGEELYSTYKWVDSLPPAILTRDEVQGGWFGPLHNDLKQEADKRLPKVLEAVESMIETHCRFEGYQAEVEAIAQLKISFHEWLKLSPSDAKPDSAELMYIIPSKPLQLQLSS